MTRTIKTRLIKNTSDHFDMHDIIENGVKIGKFTFCRDRRDINSRIVIRCSGTIWYDDGRKIDLSRYGFYADVIRDIKARVI